LIDRVVRPEAATRLVERAERRPRIILDAREQADLELIAVGAASPLTGFLGRDDYVSVLDRMRLASGTLWPLPFTLAASPATEAEGIDPGSDVALVDPAGRLWGVIHVRDVFDRDPRHEAQAVYGTTEPAHPGVAYLLMRPTRLVGGDVDVLPLPRDLPFADYRLAPAALRDAIAARGWRRVAGFQTRNPIHRAHEYLTKLALEFAEGLVIHPLVGETKRDDVPAAVRFRAYEVLIEKYYPRDRVLLAAFPGAMRYAGPREALMHALLRKNYGISHFIVGRDHAGVGDYYPPFAAQEIFDEFEIAELGVVPLKLDAAFFCRGCQGMASARSCPHDGAARVELSGSRVRSLLESGGDLPPEFTRPEVADILRAHYRTGVAPVAAQPSPVRASAAPEPAARRDTPTSNGPPRGAIVWFTGLPGAGKSTLAEKLRDRLVAGGRAAEVLDGEDMRTHLSRDLGFSKADRDTNIARIAFVARLLARHGVIVITAAISPYAEARADARRAAARAGVTFVEVFADASVESLVARDVKGLYRKALAGEIAQFTGISDPYERPECPDVTVHTDRESVDESLERIWSALGPCLSPIRGS
jgi:ATP sulfurylase/adenylyl-sulfate kinase